MLVIDMRRRLACDSHDENLVSYEETSKVHARLFPDQCD